MIYKWLVKKAYYKNSKQKLSKRGGQRVRRRESEKERKERKRKENRKEGRKGKRGREGGILFCLLLLELVTPCRHNPNC